ncbi:AAA family ATPase [PVC group bacterium]|nr:AAA family ATPase [PVC group bacterium]
MIKRIPYAVANYEQIASDNYYFVDKTRFIRTLEEYKIPVFLRPRRFGKSLWCSLLECYYDVNRADRFDELFGNTDIGREPTSLRNSHLVMRFDFSVVEVKPNLAAMEQSFNGACHDALRVFVANYRSHADFSETLDASSASDALRSILSTVSSQNTPHLYIIIDEYDNFTNQLITSHQDGLYEELTTGDSFLRTFFKVIKAGVGEGSVDRVFITGVLPITIDDLTSGFNIAQIITLEEDTLLMMGFTQSEADKYIKKVFDDGNLPAEQLPQVRELVRSHYNGYRFLPDSEETLYNSTILNFFLDKLVRRKGRIPTEMIDANLRVDINWLRRLTGSDEATRELLETLMFDGTLPADITKLQAQFNMNQFFQKDFYPLSLYYLGMLTFKDQFTMEFPNLTMKTIFTNYFNEIERISVSDGYTDMFKGFLKDHNLAALFGGYWERYIGQIPAQAFDKVNENFIRTTFYELCTRYLFYDLIFSIEVNHPSGRSDWEAVGRPGKGFENQAILIEFKHFSRAEAERLDVLNWDNPQQEDIEQVTGYANDIQAKYQELSIHCHVCYTISCDSFRFFKL